MTSMLTLEDLILQKTTSFPDREYILTETHYRSGIPISPLSIVNHFTFVTQSFQDKFYAELCKLLDRSLQNASPDPKEPELRDVLSRNYHPTNAASESIAVPDDVATWMVEKKFPHSLAFGAVDQIKIEIDEAIDVGRFSEDDDARKCIRNLRRCFAKSDNIFDIEEIIQRYTGVALAKIETPPDKTLESADREASGILKDFESIANVRPQDVYPILGGDDVQAQPAPARREKYWVYRFKPEHVKSFGSSDQTRPRVALLSSEHTQHYGATFIVSFPESDSRSVHVWQKELFDRAGKQWIKQEGMYAWNYLPTIPTDQQFPGRRLSGSKYVFVPFLFFLRQALSLTMDGGASGEVHGVEMPLRSHYVLAISGFLAALIKCHAPARIQSSSPLAALAVMQPPTNGDVASHRRFLNELDKVLGSVDLESREFWRQLPPDARLSSSTQASARRSNSSNCASV